MRDALVPLVGQRITVVAPVMRLGSRTAWTGVKQPTVLLGPIRDPEGNLLASHLWFHMGKRLAALAPEPGNLISLTGRVARYHRRRRQWHGEAVRYDDDLGLVYPSRCAVLARAMVPAVVEHVSDRIHEAEPPAVLPPAVPARARILEALTALSTEEPEGVSLTKLNAQAGVPPLSLLSLLKKLGNTGTVIFTPTGRVFLAATPAQSLEGSLHHVR